MSVNKVILIGNLGKDPEVISPNGTNITKFNIATSRKFKDKEETEWHSIVTFGKLAEVCGQYLAKGRQVYVEGRLQTRKWEKDGGTHYKTEIIAEVVQFIDGQNNQNERNDYNKKKEDGLKDSKKLQDDDFIPF